MVGDGAREQLPLVIERNLVGALRGAEHGDDNTDDRDGDDNANRHHDAAAFVATIDNALVAGFRRSQGQLPPPNGFLLPNT
jgi:hypothetical protein